VGSRIAHELINHTIHPMHTPTDGGEQGALQTNKQIKIDVPAGVQDGTKLRIKGQWVSRLGQTVGQLVILSLNTTTPQYPYTHNSNNHTSPPQ
jgi:DnaJ-class molecular chaperone